MEKNLKQLEARRDESYKLLYPACEAEEELSNVIDELAVCIAGIEDEIEFIRYCNTPCWRYVC